MLILVGRFDRDLMVKLFFSLPIMSAEIATLVTYCLGGLTDAWFAQSGGVELAVDSQRLLGVPGDQSWARKSLVPQAVEAQDVDRLVGHCLEG